MIQEEDDEPNWFPLWEELPTPEELTPLSQTLITSDLALAFDIPTSHVHHPQQPPTPSPLHQDDPTLPPLQPDFELREMGGAAADEAARTLKRPRLVWTPQLHKRFVEAVAHLGIQNAVPKTIMQLMSVDGLTRENVASHLQKYRLYLKRVQGGAAGGAVSSADAAADYLFASAPLPHQFLGHGPTGLSIRGVVARGEVPDHFMPFEPVTTLQHHHRMAAVAAAAATTSAATHPPPQQYYPHGHMNHLTRQQQQPAVQKLVCLGGAGMVTSPRPPGSHAENLEPDAGTEGGRRVLTLFPAGGGSWWLGLSSKR